MQKRNTHNQLEIHLESVKSKESVKLKETEKITATTNNNETENTGERESEKHSETNISHNKKNKQDISHEVETINTSNSQENI